MSSEKNANRALWAIVGILATGIVIIGSALFTYSTAGYKGMVQNRERISVNEARQDMMLDKLDEIASDVKTLLSHGSKK